MSAAAGTDVAAGALAAASLSPQRVLCLCLGNICRSPLAEGILRREVASRKLTGWVIDSAGTSSEHEGDQPDARSIAVAKRNGIDITTHQAQQLTAKHWTSFDIILAMDSSNYRNALRVKPANSMSRDSHSTAKLLMYLPKEAGDVPDPWYGSAAGFTDCYNLLDKHTSHVFSAIHAAQSAKA